MIFLKDKNVPCFRPPQFEFRKKTKVDFSELNDFFSTHKLEVLWNSNVNFTSLRNDTHFKFQPFTVPSKVK